jgi:protein O-mannosyl-transferase
MAPALTPADAARRLSRSLALVFATGVAIYLPTAHYGLVQDDRAVVGANPRAQSVVAALRAFNQPYWPTQSGGEYYRPLTVLSYAVDWTLSNGRPGWLHVASGLWHGLACVLVTLVLAHWMSPAAATAAGVVFALHPVHVEAVAGLVGRAEVLAAAGILGAVLCARRRWWAASVACAAAAMLSKEHGVVAGVVIVLDRWLRGSEEPKYPAALYAALGVVTTAYLIAWYTIGHHATADVAPVFLDAGTGQRLAVALPAVLRAARLLVWPAGLSADYSPQVIPAHVGFSGAALGGALIVAGTLTLAWRARRAAPAVSFAAGTASLAYLPTSNLLFPSGIVLAERNLYLPVLLVATLAGVALQRAQSRWPPRRVAVVAAALAATLGWRTLARLPVWRDNRTFLLTLLAEHPESYRAHWSAAAVLAGLGDTAAARSEYTRADSLFDGDPHLDASRAFFLLSLSDTAGAGPLVARARSRIASEPIALRAQFLLMKRRGDAAGAAVLADSVRTRLPWEAPWYDAQ